MRHGHAMHDFQEFHAGSLLCVIEACFSHLVTKLQIFVTIQNHLSFCNNERKILQQRTTKKILALPWGGVSQGCQLPWGGVQAHAVLPWGLKPPHPPRFLLTWTLVGFLTSLTLSLFDYFCVPIDFGTGGTLFYQQGTLTTGASAGVPAAVSFPGHTG